MREWNLAPSGTCCSDMDYKKRIKQRNRAGRSMLLRDGWNFGERRHSLRSLPCIGLQR